MSTLQKFAGARSTLRVSSSLLALVVLGGLACGCQHHDQGLTRVHPLQRSVDEMTLLFDSDRRDIRLHFTDSSVSGLLDDDDFMAYLSLPLEFGYNPQFNESGIAVGRGSAGFVLTGLFESDEENWASTRIWKSDSEAELDSTELLQLSLQRSTIYDPGVLRALDTGRGLQILDFASLVEPTEVASASVNPENRPTD